MHILNPFEMIRFFMKKADSSFVSPIVRGQGGFPQGTEMARRWEGFQKRVVPEIYHANLVGCM